MTIEPPNVGVANTRELQMSFEVGTLHQKARFLLLPIIFPLIVSRSKKRAFILPPTLFPRNSSTQYSAFKGSTNPGNVSTDTRRVCACAV